ncbi:BZ3500_MvSof-1268-A1-R1_Chr5-2g07819 [Microbotryum saponariae]|uniref:glutaminase n=1 Tax=Microbotryum saponariae TaxID=289078 RepID=A0A2X0MDZ7_9BASI|nr:BZ3500_MvSof-1268-A1-R1_Chr5-2g07819 [Microbotryum saponariae]SDA05688.1 BZ3501_MvSof-1269-A2-R1_Chr5-2g07641 [Microbotryum saponariae]
MVQPSHPLTIGVLALQGSFAEHVEILRSLSLPPGASVTGVRTPSELERCRALIIPGGESTTMSLVAQRGGMLEPLKRFVEDARHSRGKAVYGTCAGMILLAKEVIGAKEGYKGLQGVDCRIVRNQYGRQVLANPTFRQAESFAHPLEISSLASSSIPYNAIFIRAPVIHSLIPPQDASSPQVEVLVRVPRSVLPSPTKAAIAVGGASELGPDADVVMLRQGDILMTSFHPELTPDTRIHDWWCRTMVFKE